MTRSVERTAYQASNDEKTWAALVHAAAFAGLVIPLFGFLLGPLIVWLAKRDNLPLVDDQGREAVNFQLTMVLIALLGFFVILLGAWLILPLFIPLGGLLLITNVILTIVATVQASEGKRYRHPVCIRFIR